MEFEIWCYWKFFRPESAQARLCGNFSEFRKFRLRGKSSQLFRGVAKCANPTFYRVCALRDFLISFGKRHLIKTVIIWKSDSPGIFLEMKQNVNNYQEKQLLFETFPKWSGPNWSKPGGTILKKRSERLGCQKRPCIVFCDLRFSKYGVTECSEKRTFNPGRDHMGSSACKARLLEHSRAHFFAPCRAQSREQCVLGPDCSE